MQRLPRGPLTPPQRCLLLYCPPGPTSPSKWDSVDLGLAALSRTPDTAPTPPPGFPSGLIPTVMQLPFRCLCFCLLIVKCHFYPGLLYSHGARVALHPAESWRLRPPGSLSPWASPPVYPQQLTFSVQVQRAVEEGRHHPTELLLPQGPCLPKEHHNPPCCPVRNLHVLSPSSSPSLATAG